MRRGVRAIAGTMVRLHIFPTPWVEELFCHLSLVSSAPCQHQIPMLTQWGSYPGSVHGKPKICGIKAISHPCCFLSTRHVPDHPLAQLFSRIRKKFIISSFPNIPKTEPTLGGGSSQTHPTVKGLITVLSGE